MTKFLEGVKFENGIEVRRTKNNQTEKCGALKNIYTTLDMSSFFSILLLRN